MTLWPAELKGHRLLRTGRFLLVDKRLAPDSRIILWFENQFACDGSAWIEAGRNGVIHIPVTPEQARSYLEGISYTLYLYQW